VDLSARQILDVWEQASGVRHEHRSRLLLSLGQPGMASHDIDDLCLGERNQRLLQIRKALFGSKLEAYVECPGCGEALDLAFLVDELGFDQVKNLSASQFIEDELLNASVRLPNGHDLGALANVSSVEEGRALLFSRCVSDLHFKGKPTELSTLDESVLSTLESLIADLDPRMELLFDLLCPACEKQWQAPLDVGAFLWREFDTHARELLENIHLLARTYGWSESNILSMSKARRHYYVERLLQ